MNIRETALNVASVVVTIAALSVTGLRVRDEFFPPRPRPPEPKHVREWREYQNAGLRIGSPQARLVIVEFADFQCPFCKKAAGELERLVQESNGQVAVLFRHFPLAAHPYAMDAARSAECASRAGRFGAYYDILFSEQDSIGNKPWQRFAAEAGISDTATFNRCVGDSTVVAAIERDRQAGERLGVAGTPTFLVNDLEVGGADFGRS